MLKRTIPSELSTDLKFAEHTQLYTMKNGYANDRRLNLNLTAGISFLPSNYTTFWTLNRATSIAQCSSFQCTLPQKNTYKRSFCFRWQTDPEMFLMKGRGLQYQSASLWFDWVGLNGTFSKTRLHWALKIRNSVKRLTSVSLWSTWKQLSYWTELFWYCRSWQRSLQPACEKHLISLVQLTRCDTKPQKNSVDNGKTILQHQCHVSTAVGGIMKPVYVDRNCRFCQIIAPTANKITIQIHRNLQHKTLMINGACIKLRSFSRDAHYIRESLTLNQ